MKRRVKEKILVPVDGSDRSMSTVRYITKFDPFYQKEVVFFHVFSSVPESYWDLEKDPRSTATVKQVRTWKIQQTKETKAFMERAHQILVKSGFPPDSINIKIQKREKGIARDIIREALDGYQAVVTRRRGMTGIRGNVLGSVAAKLVQRLSFVPLILAGRRPAGNKMLIAFDGSDGAWRAVEFVGAMLAGFDFNLRLIHVIRGKGNQRYERPRMYSPKKYKTKIQKEMTLLLNEAKSKLIDMGFEPNTVSIQLITDVFSRAGAIINEAKREDFGTIVLGRRGHSWVRDFFIGRVTNKVIHMASDRTVWVIR